MLIERNIQEDEQVGVIFSIRAWLDSWTYQRKGWRQPIPKSISTIMPTTSEDAWSRREREIHPTDKTISLIPIYFETSSYWICENKVEIIPPPPREIINNLGNFTEERTWQLLPLRKRVNSNEFFKIISIPYLFNPFCVFSSIRFLFFFFFFCLPKIDCQSTTSYIYSTVLRWISFIPFLCFFLYTHLTLLNNEFFLLSILLEIN